MKKIFSLSIVSVFLLSATCKKESDEPGGGPDIVLPTDGYICTNGKTHVGNVVTFYWTTIAWNITSYGKDFVRPEDQVSFIIGGNNTVSIKRKTPHMHQNREYKWFAIEVNSFPQGSSFPDHPYLWELTDTQSELTQFIIHRNDDDKLKFTIESKAYPGYYLSIGKSKNSVQNVDNNLTFTRSAKVWWFEKP